MLTSQHVFVRGYSTRHRGPVAGRTGGTVLKRRGSQRMPCNHRPPRRYPVTLHVACT